MQSELNNYHPDLLTIDPTCQVDGLIVKQNSEIAMANSFEYVQVTGTGFLPTETNGVVKSSQVLCIFNTDRVNHFVTVAKIIDDTQLK